MEIALQPSGFISGWMGTTLKYPDKDLFFRNLDGTGNLLRRVDLRGKTIVNQSVMLSTSMAGGAIIQSFTFKLLTDGEPFYEGTAVFGYFSNEALTNQLGIDNGRITNAWHVDNNREAERIDLRDASHAFFKAPAGKPHYRLPGGQLHFIDTVDVVEGGGKAGKGYVYAERTIDATDWFFRYHFHQDPVMPGSLGVEAIIETMQTWALKNNLGANFKNPRFAQPLSKVVWKYRGQITPINKKMNLDVHITDVRYEDGRVVVVGDANLSKDGLRIYEVKDIVVCIEEA
jgi:3-hydroxymyristoyl/3-hydroxydecanoyl-(acyl carrier protein) dehydratase